MRKLGRFFLSCRKKILVVVFELFSDNFVILFFEQKNCQKCFSFLPNAISCQCFVDLSRNYPNSPLCIFLYCATLFCLVGLTKSWNVFLLEAPFLSSEDTHTMLLLVDLLIVLLVWKSVFCSFDVLLDSFLVGFWKWTRPTWQKKKHKVKSEWLCVCVGCWPQLEEKGESVVVRPCFRLRISSFSKFGSLFWIPKQWTREHSLFLFGYSKRDFSWSVTCCEESVSVEIWKERK